MNGAIKRNYLKHIYLVLFRKMSSFTRTYLTLLQPYAVDHLARESMKSAANCVN